jgi:hypothetical protein
MPVGKTAATQAKPVPMATESPTLAKPGRVRLSKALARKPAVKAAVEKTRAAPKKHNGGSPEKHNGGSRKKLKLRSSRYKIPDNEYAQLTAIKNRVLALGMSVKRSELLRAGLMLLAALEDVPLKKAVAKVNFVSPARPPSGTAGVAKKAS